MQVNLEFYLIITIFIAGLVGTARLILGAHKPFEIYMGFLTGLIIVASVMFIV
jgi:membrane-associated phospholipid phosphatase